MCSLCEQFATDSMEIQHGSSIRELYATCLGQRATQQGKALLSPFHRLVPLGVESASVCMCVNDAVMRVGAQPNGHLTGAVALS